MARTLEDIRASRPKVDRAKVRATTDADMARQAAEDDSAPAAPLSEFVKRRPGERGPGKAMPKVQIAIRLDSEALDAWKGSGAGWQTRIRELVTREAPRRSAAGPHEVRHFANKHGITREQASGLIEKGVGDQADFNPGATPNAKRRA